MQHDHRIYSDFKSEVDSFRNNFEKEISQIPEKLLPLANYYLEKRLFIVNKNRVKFDPLVGRPVPYLVFWFSDSLGLKSEQTIRQLALSLYHISIVVSIRDDLVDGRKITHGEKFSEHAYLALANYFYSRYYQIFSKIFQPDSLFWHILAQNHLEQWPNYESWSYLFNRRKETPIQPLSASFMANSSRYLVAITLPTLAAVAILTNNERRIDHMGAFLRNYCMGWKIADDLRDWRKDMKVSNYNHSAVIYQALNFAKESRIDAEMMRSIFFNKHYIESVYGAIFRHYRNAKKVIQSFNSLYLNNFIDSQIEFYSKERDSLLSGRNNIKNSLTRILQAKN